MDIKPRQLEIMEAAGQLMTESGYAALTTKRLAEQVCQAQSSEGTAAGASIAAGNDAAPNGLATVQLHRVFRESA